MLVEKLQIRGAGSGSRRVSPERRYWQQSAVGNKLCFVAGVSNREIQVGCRWHVEHLGLDRSKCLLHVTAETGSGTDVVTFPGTHLQDQIVCIRPGDEICSIVLHHLVEGCAGGFLGSP